MEAIVKITLKEWLGDYWEIIVSEVEDKKKIILGLLDLIKQCMLADEFELFSLVTKINNDLIDEEQAEEEIENYIAYLDLDDDFDIMVDEFPLSRFNINYQKFSLLVLEKYKWIFDNSFRYDKKDLMPDKDISCDAYIYILADNIYFRFKCIEGSLIYKYNEKKKEEALSILNRKWDEITDEDYDKAIDMLKSAEAYNELVEVLSTGVYIKGDNGCKVKRSDKIAALKIEEEVTKKRLKIGVIC